MKGAQLSGAEEDAELDALAAAISRVGIGGAREETAAADDAASTGAATASDLVSAPDVALARALRALVAEDVTSNVEPSSLPHVSAGAGDDDVDVFDDETARDISGGSYDTRASEHGVSSRPSSAAPLERRSKLVVRYKLNRERADVAEGDEGDEVASSMKGMHASSTSFSGASEAAAAGDAAAAAAGDAREDSTDATSTSSSSGRHPRESAPGPRPRKEPVNPDKVHPTPQRKPRSKRTVAAPSGGFAAFRERRREEARHRSADAAAAAALGAELEAKATLAVPRRLRAETDESLVVGLVFSDEMELHEGPPNHFERPARHAAVVAKLVKEGLDRRCAVVDARPATDDELLTCHSRAHIDAVETTFDAASDATVQGSGDIYWTTHTSRAARVAAGSACEAATRVARGDIQRAFAVVRPPGHHAECGRTMGFCFYNNAAVAARASLRTPGVDRVLILDWDVHHGNGIQDILYDDPNVLYVSLHRHDEGFYPGTGALEETGVGPGVGYTVNVPWEEKGLGDADYLAAFDLVIDPIATAFGPDLVIIAAGFDAAEGDPLGGMKVSDQGFALMTQRLTRLAGGRCVAALEGGYGLSATANAAAATLEALLGFSTPALSSRRRPKRSSVELLRKVVDAHRKHWPVLGSDSQEAKLRAAIKATQVVGKENSA